MSRRAACRIAFTVLAFGLLMAGLVVGDVTAQTDNALDFNDQETSDTFIVENVSSDTPSVLVVTYESNGDRIVAGFTDNDFNGSDVTVSIQTRGGLPGKHTAHLIPFSGVSSETQNTGVLSNTHCEHYR